jgi:hypothetical protein
MYLVFLFSLLLLMTMLFRPLYYQLALFLFMQQGPIIK